MVISSGKIKDDKYKYKYINCMRECIAVFAYLGAFVLVCMCGAHWAHCGASVVIHYRHLRCTRQYFAHGAVCIALFLLLVESRI